MTLVPTANEAVDIADAQSRGSSGNDDDGVLATFYTRPVYNKVKSQAEGRPIYDGKPFIKIVIPGDNKNEVDRPVRDDDQKRWPNAWARYVDHEEGSLDGTPIDEWSYLDVTRKAALKHLGIRTVEQLANVPDGQLHKIGMDGREVREWAEQFLKPQSDRETALREQNGLLKRQVESLEASLAEAKRQLNEPPKRAPGRQKKDAEAA